MTRSVHPSPTRSFSIGRVWHQLRMLVPNLAIVVGVWLMLQEAHPEAHVVGLVLMAGGVWEL